MFGQPTVVVLQDVASEPSVVIADTGLFKAPVFPGCAGRIVVTPNQRASNQQNRRREIVPEHQPGAFDALISLQAPSLLIWPENG